MPLSGKPVSKPPRSFGRVWRYAAAHPILAVLVLAGFAAAAITLTYTNTSTLSTSVTPAPIQFVAGDDAGPSALTDYVSAYTISTNKTYMTATVKGVPEATLTVGSFFKLQNVDDASHDITLSTPQVSNAYVSVYTIQIFNGADVSQGTLTLTDATPTVSVTIPASSTFYAKLTLRLATGAGIDNVALTNALTLTTTA